MKMPFGKHRGEELEDIPTHYLQWIAENVTDNTALVNEAEEQLAMREGHGRPASRDRT